VSQPYETLELRLTDGQIAAIRQRIARRKRQIIECGQIDLRGIDGTGDLTTAAPNIKQATGPSDPSLEQLSLPTQPEPPLQNPF
jgi:hypothetical protein